MSCSIDTSGSVALVVWDVPELVDLGRILRVVEQLRADTGRRCPLISRIPDGSSPPDERVRKEFIAQMPRLVEHCSALHAVVEGSGFMATIKRCAVSSISLATGLRQFMFVHARAAAIPATLSAGAPGAQRAMSEALRVLRGQGADPVSSRPWPPPFPSPSSPASSAPARPRW